MENPSTKKIFYLVEQNMFQPKESLFANLQRFIIINTTVTDYISWSEKSVKATSNLLKNFTCMIHGSTCCHLLVCFTCIIRNFKLHKAVCLKN